MKTPDEIKKGLYCCSHDEDGCNCEHCPYNLGLLESGCIAIFAADALAYIQRLERERDAAVKDLHRVARDGQICAICKYEGGSCDERQFAEMECWQWRGVQKEVE